MSESDFIIKKCNEFIENAYSMTAQEQTEAMVFIAKIHKQHIDEAHDLINRNTKINEQLLAENEEYKGDIKHYQNFIQDSNLGAQFAFYSKCKGVI